MNVDAALFIIVTKERKQRGLLLPHFIGRCLIFFFMVTRTVMHRVGICSVFFSLCSVFFL